MKTPTFEFPPIAFIRSSFREKFGIPRQPGLAPHANSRIVFLKPYARAECFEGITEFSHVWVIFQFHGTAEQGWKPTVRPPRLGGNKRLGVFATRSMYRPNALGLSLVKIEALIDGPEGKELLISGADLLDQTPVLDIKPYLPYVEAPKDAHGGYAAEAPKLLDVLWTESARVEAQHLTLSASLLALIAEVLAQDPRPAYAEGHHNPDREYGVWLEHVNVKFTIKNDLVLIQSLSFKP